MTAINAATIPEDVREAIGRLASGDRATHGETYTLLQSATEREVEWADAAWPEVLPLLEHKDNRVRSIAGQTLCGLAPSASAKLIRRDLDALLEVTRDEKFVTARHVLLALWKVGLNDAKLRALVVSKLAERFGGCVDEKNYTLVRYDILRTLRRLFDATSDEAVKTCALSLVALEEDSKYRKKYAGVWRGAG